MRKLLRSIARAYAQDHGMKFRGKKIGRFPRHRGHKMGRISSLHTRWHEMLTATIAEGRKTNAWAARYLRRKRGGAVA